MKENNVIVVQGAKKICDVPGLNSIEKQTEIRLASDRKSLHQALEGANVLFGWNFRADDLEACWNSASSLQWVHWAGAGVDAALFSGLAKSNVIMTNSAGIFDRSMAEWTLGVMIAYAKRLPETLKFQQAHKWEYRLNTRMLGQKLTIVGVGNIGRAICNLAKAFGLKTSGVGRIARDNDPIFGHIYGIDEINTTLKEADYVVLITPLTPRTECLFNSERFSAMKPGSMFINIGRGQLVDENALISALETGHIGCAALDVFCEEPLREKNPIWSAPNIIISPHMSGDYYEHFDELGKLFLHNFLRFQKGEQLLNIVDKSLGFVPSITSA